MKLIGLVIKCHTQEQRNIGVSQALKYLNLVYNSLFVRSSNFFRELFDLNFSPLPLSYKSFLRVFLSSNRLYLIKLDPTNSDILPYQSFWSHSNFLFFAIILAFIQPWQGLVHCRSVYLITASTDESEVCRYHSWEILVNLGYIYFLYLLFFTICTFVDKINWRIKLFNDLRIEWGVIGFNGAWRF